MKYWLFLCISFNLFLGACQSLETVIDIELEEEPSELVVECYLQQGQPFRLLLTETKRYFDPVNACPFVREALVVITYQGQRDTLQEATYTSKSCSSILPFFDQDSIRFYNYGSDNICFAAPGEEFLLEVWDIANERYISAVTHFLPVVPIDVLSHSDYNSTDTAAIPAPKTAVTLGCKDDVQTRNYYRFTLHKNALWQQDSTGGIFDKVAIQPIFDVTLFDQGVYSDGVILQRSDYSFFFGESAIGTIYHIDRFYYEYLTTSRAARDANLNPFLQPAKVKSNVQGGQGIFTALSFDRLTLAITY
ncbi:MAG: DUF4249 family protein [Aureispira sp.]